MTDLDQVGRVAEVLETYEVFFDRPCRHEPVENADTSRLVVGSARTSTAERLLTDDCARALLVIVDVSCRVAQSVCREKERIAVRGKAAAQGGISRGTGQHTCTCLDSHCTGQSI